MRVVAMQGPMLSAVRRYSPCCFDLFSRYWPLRQLSQQKLGCYANRATNLHEFDYFQAPLPTFVFRHERLMSMKTSRQILLREVSIMSGRD